MKFVPINEENRLAVNAFISEQWLSTEMVLRGDVIDMTRVEGIVTLDNDKIIALLTYCINDNVCEILSLDSLLEKNGVGTSLIEKIITIARQEQCRKIVVITTNDNLNAMRFYQKRGFDMVRLYHNALDVSRKLKPSIPLLGENNIPLQHEVEFEYNLEKNNTNNI